jgi:histidinol-phosphate aminotransferase
MSDAIARLARPEILALKPYSHASWNPGLTRLHANEAPWRQAADTTLAGLNRYPEPQPALLVSRLAALYGVANDRLLVTRGSDEAIDLLSRIFLRAGRDAVLQFPPTFGMYQVATRIQGGAVLEVPLKAQDGWQIDVDRALAAWTTDVKIVYLCSPNNPTGNLIESSRVAALCRALDGKAIVVIDEAYIEWSQRPSAAEWLDTYETLAVLRTLSKAHALAGARCGALLARPQLIQLARRIVEPYNLSQPSIEAALAALEPAAVAATQLRLAALLAERERLCQSLAGNPAITRVWPSDANFLLVDCGHADRLLQAATRGGTLVRDMRGHPSLPNSLRITVGSREENDRLIESWRTP